MTDFDPKLDVQVAGNDIKITLFGTGYSVTYFKRRGSPGLYAKGIVHEDDPHVLILPNFSRKRGRSPTTRPAIWGGSFSVGFGRCPFLFPGEACDNHPLTRITELSCCGQCFPRGPQISLQRPRPLYSGAVSLFVLRLDCVR